MKRHCCLQQLIFASPMKGIQPLGAIAKHETQYTLNTSSAVFLMMKDRGSEVLYTLQQESDVEKACWSVTLTGDRSPRAPSRVASPLQGKQGHSRDCQLLFIGTGLGTGTSHTPSNRDEHPNHRLVGTTWDSGHSKKYRNRTSFLSCSPWRGPLKARDMSTQFLTTSDKTLTITTRIQPCFTH